MKPWVGMDNFDLLKEWDGGRPVWIIQLPAGPDLRVTPFFYSAVFEFLRALHSSGTRMTCAFRWEQEAETNPSVVSAMDKLLNKSGSVHMTVMSRSLGRALFDFGYQHFMDRRTFGYPCIQVIKSTPAIIMGQLDLTESGRA